MLTLVASRHRIPWVLLAAGLLAGCQAAHSDPSPHPSSLAADAPPTSISSVCQSDKVRCVRLESNGWAILYEGTGKPREAVIVELGGPGIAPLIPSLLRAQLPPSLAPRNLVVVVEPWLTAGPHGCPSRPLSEFHGNPQGEAGGCGIEQMQYTPDGYRLAAQEAEAALNVDIVGAYAVSFGVHRVQALPGERLRWLILKSPSPVPEVTGREELEQRAQLTVDLLRTEFQCGSACLNAMVIKDDSNPYRDIYATFSLLYNLEENRSLILFRTSRGVWPSGFDASKAARRFTGISSSGEISADSMAYLAGECALRGGWADGAVQNPFLAALQGFHRVCVDVTHDHPESSKSPIRTLILINRQDTVIPDASQEEWARRFLSASVLRFDWAGHGGSGANVNSRVASFISEGGS